MFIRLKVVVRSDLPDLIPLKFWYGFEMTKIKTIDALRNDIINKHFKSQKQNFKYVILIIDKFTLPLFESTSLVRDSEILE